MRIKKFQDLWDVSATTKTDLGLSDTWVRMLGIERSVGMVNAHGVVRAYGTSESMPYNWAKRVHKVLLAARRKLIADGALKKPKRKS